MDPVQGSKAITRHGHSGFLGMEYVGHGEDWFELALPWREDLVGVEETGVLASGPIISLLDNCTSMSVWARRGEFQPQVTLDLRIDYVRAATPGKTIIARAECYQLRRSMAFVRGIAHDGELTDPVAHAAGIFMLVEASGWMKA
ncbi:PaaI family thioesterase [Novosphingobium sp. NBM11]|nr:MULTISPECIES: PaaI family thioesterase [unclassified Novosphingobium]MBF5089735.1 PaaI family thioesterase [Novosphingobium sp. NBM11]